MKNYTRQEWAQLTDEERGPCYEWQGARTSAGYGKKSFGNSRDAVNHRTMLTHRLAWINDNGLIPVETPLVLHHCDNPPCCNVEHLYLGTHADNVADKTEKNRQYRATGLTWDAVRELRTRAIRGRAPDNNVRALAMEFDISVRTLGKILANTTWRE